MDEEKSARRVVGWGFAKVDGSPPVTCEWGIVTEFQLVRSSGPRPDPAWTFSDKWGHFHAHSDNLSRYPTLYQRTRHRGYNRRDGALECRVCSEGWDETYYECRVCGEEIRPGVIEGEHSTRVESEQSWWVTILDHLQVNLNSQREVTVQIDAGDRGHFFGVAAIASLDISTNSCTYFLAGTGSLGRRGDGS